MTTISKKHRGVRIFISLIFILFLSGCAVLAPKQRVTVREVIDMSKDGVPAEAIVRKMRDSNSVYPLTATQLTELHDMGVADRVLNYMQQTYIDEQRQEQNALDWGDGIWPGMTW
jgi:hypothetical protein